MMFRRFAVLVVLSLLFSLPFLFLPMLSLATNWQYPAWLPQRMELSNWKAIFSAQSDLLTSLLLSISISASVAFTATLIGLITSRSIALHRWKDQLLFVAYFPYILSPV